MDRLSDKLLNIINEQDFCFTPEEMRTVEKAMARFFAYEDTGLEPKEVSEYQNLCASYVEAGLDAKFIQFCIEAANCGVTTESLCNLAHAEEDGRIVILKCKPDNIFYRLLYDGIAVSRFDGFEINEDGEKHWLYGDEYFGESDFGKTVFLSYSEAKAAMEMKE